MKLVSDAIAALGIPIPGAIPRTDLVLPERHLGLVQANEHGDLAQRLARLAEIAARHLDLDAIRRLAAHPRLATPAPAPKIAPPGQRIALAADEAFSFVYPHVLDGWRERRRRDRDLLAARRRGAAEHCDSCWLPGGYPELHARLAAAERFRATLARFAATRPVHGECGGYMVLGISLIDGDGASHRMAGLLGHSTSFAQPKLHLGYREEASAQALGRGGHAAPRARISPCGPW